MLILGIVETNIKRGNLSLSLIDVGGQRSERKKWWHCFDCVNAVIFVTAISEYDQFLNEDPTVNRMHESIKLFESICNNKWFIGASMLLFLNKKDVFDEKISYSPLTQCFKEYTGAEDKYETSDYIRSQFCKQKKSDRPLYLHFTCAKDTRNVHILFDVVCDAIVSLNLKQVGFV